VHKAPRLFWLLAVEGSACLVFLLLIPQDPQNTFLFGYSLIRLVMALGLLLAVLGLVWMALEVRRGARFGTRVENFLGGSLVSAGIPLPLVLLPLFIVGVLGCVLYAVAWFNYAELYGAVFLRLSPVVLFAALVSAHGLIALRAYWHDFGVRLQHFQSSLKRFDRTYKMTWVLVLILFVIVGYAYYHMATNHSRDVNDDPQFSDQNTYLLIAEKAFETNFQYKGDRNRTPLFPYLLALIYEPSLDQDAFFERGVQLNILLSLAMLLGIFLLSRVFIPTGQAALLTLIAASSVYVYKAGYVQPELLYFTLSFASFTLMTWMLVRPSLILGIATGAITALAYLAKASILPGLALFIVIFLLQRGFFWYTRWRKASGHQSWGAELRFGVLPLILVVVSFLALLFPYLQENKTIFGHYFYNVNSTFYIWYDSWDEVVSGTRSFGDTAGWPDMPPEEIPSLGKYLREHTLQQIADRLSRGGLSQINIITRPYSRFNYLAIYSLALLVFCLFNVRKTFAILREYAFLVLFCLTYFVGHLVLFAWYSPIANYHDARFTYSLFLPFLFSLFVALNKISERVRQIRLGSRSVHTKSLLWIVHGIVLLMILYEMAFVAPHRLAKRYYGK